MYAMVRTFARSEGSHTNVDYSRESLPDTVEAVRTKQLSYRKAACQFENTIRYASNAVEVFAQVR